MNLGDRVSEWAEKVCSVKALVLIGSRARSSADHVWRADHQSDWDFQIITSKPAQFANADWTKPLGLELQMYALRRATLGNVPKPTAIFKGAEADFVIIPSGTLMVARWALRMGIHRHSDAFRRRLQDLAVVIRPGWNFLKGKTSWEPFYRSVVENVSDARLDDDAVKRLADAFVCEALWTHRKIDRGEFLAAQRCFHRNLLETNFQLLHELRLRSEQRSFPEIRRAEKILNQSQLAAVFDSVALNETSLRAGVQKACATCIEFTHALVGPTWKWPDNLSLNYRD